MNSFRKYNPRQKILFPSIAIEVKSIYQNLKKLYTVSPTFAKNIKICLIYKQTKKLCKDIL